MTAPAFDAAAFRDAQRQEWDEAATGWDKWGDFIERSSAPVTERMLELAGLEAGQHVLDVACGAGDPALSAARRVGPTGRVVGTDLSPRMIELARTRATTAGLDHLTFQVGDVAELELGDASFDRALCRFGLMLFADPVHSAARVCRFLRPGGRFVACVWASPDRVPFLGLAAGTIMRELELPPPPPDAPGLFSLGQEPRLEQVVRDGGFREVDVESLGTLVTLDSAEQYTEMIRDVATVLRKLVEAQPPERQQAVWATLTDAARAHASEDGTVTLPGEVLLVTATR